KSGFLIKVAELSLVLLRRGLTKFWCRVLLRCTEMENGVLSVPTPATHAPIRSFVLLPRAFLKSPPVRRHDNTDRSLLSVFEVAVATGMVTLAYVERAAARHKAALDAGKQSAKEKRKEWGAAIAAVRRNKQVHGIDVSFADFMSELYYKARTRIYDTP